MKRAGKARGFSLMELLMVVAVSLAMMAAIAPMLATTISHLRLRSTANSVAGLLRDVRMRAIKDDRTYAVRRLQDPTGSLLFGDLDGDGSLGALEPAIYVADALEPSGPFGVDPLQLEFVPQANPTAIAFNARGIPCVLGATTCSTAAGGLVVGYAMYLREIGTVGEPRWAAITASPSGRTRTWFHDGEIWR